MGRQTRAKYRRWRRAEEEVRRSRQAWRVASLCVVVIAAFAAYMFYDRIYSEPKEKEPPSPEAPRPVTLYQPEVAPLPPAPVQEQSSSGEERPDIPKTRAKSRRVAMERYWEHEQPNIAPTNVSSQPAVPNPGPVTVIAPPAPPAPPAPIRASSTRPMPKKKPAVVRVTQEKQKKKKKKIVVRQSPTKPKKPTVIRVPPGPAGTSTLHEVEATPVDD